MKSQWLEACAMSSSRSVGRALDIFELLAHFPKGLAQTEIASTLKIPKGGLHDLLQVFLERGYVEETPVGRRYCVGLRLFEAGSTYMAQIDLLEVAIPVIEIINALTGESVDLSVRDGSEMVSIYKKKASFALRYDSALGERIPGHTSAVGKAILAHLSQKELHQLLPHNHLPRLTRRTITSRDGFERELAKVRQTGIAYNLEEMFNGTCAAASVILDDRGVARAGISITAPTTRFQGKRAQFGEMAKIGAEIIAIRMGYRRGNHILEMSDLKRAWDTINEGTDPAP